MSKPTEDHWSDRFSTPPQPSWAQLEAILGDIATFPKAEAIVRSGLSGIAKTAVFKPSSMVWTEILLLACVVQDEPGPPISWTAGEAPMS